MSLPSGLSYVTVTLTDAVDMAGNVLAGSVAFQACDPSTLKPISFTSSGTLIVPSYVVATLDSTGSFSQELVATDSDNLTPTGFVWRIQQRWPSAAAPTFVSLPKATTPVSLLSLVPVVPSTLPPIPGSNYVSEVNGETGVVTGLAPLASPALTGTPTAPTASALTDSTQIATTAYADSAVAALKAASTWNGRTLPTSPQSGDYAVADVTGAAPIIENVDALTYASTVTLPAPSSTKDTMATLTLTGACTISPPTADAGASITLQVSQDSTGGHAITWSGIKWPGGTAPSLPTTASSISLLTLVCVDGTNWLGGVAGTLYS